MSSNLSIESPNFEKITKEAGDFTANAINTLWYAMNDTREVQRRQNRLATDTLTPKVLSISAAASVDNRDLEGCSIVSFTGASAQNLTGFRAPDTNASRVIFIQVSGAGTITVKNNATSETANQIVTSTGADVARATNTGMVLAYLAGKWRQVV